MSGKAIGSNTFILLSRFYTKLPSKYLYPQIDVAVSLGQEIYFYCMW